MNGIRERSLKVLMLGASLDVKGGITSVEKLILQQAPAHLEIDHIPTFAPGSARHNIQVFVKAAAKLTQALLRKQSVDIIHIHFSERGSTFRKWLLLLIAVPFGKPIVLHAHGATYQEFFAGLPALARQAIVHLFKQCTKMIVLSENWKTFYAQAFQLRETQMEVLYNPVNVPAAVPRRSERDLTTFVFLGRIGRRGGALDLTKSVVSFPQQDKGAFDLIQAFAQLSESERTRARLIVAGNGDVEQAQQLVETLNLSQVIEIKPWLTAAERDALLEKADVFVLPSYNEGLPMSMLEAMAWGLPVIVTPVGGIPEVITHDQNGLLIEPGNHSELAQAMRRLLHSEDLRLRLGEAARNRVQPLKIENYMVSLLELYQSTIESPAPLSTVPMPKPVSIR
jgi:glycosyltransferase involved in cell wall biosynthesis